MTHVTLEVDVCGCNGVTDPFGPATVMSDEVPATSLDATPGSAAWCRCTAALRGGGAVFPARLSAMAPASDPQLSSLGASIDDLARRAAELAQALESDGASEPAASLFEVERSLRMAVRSLERARRTLPS